MNVIVCVDDRGGMLFNRRRQSQDRILREHLLALTGDRPLRMNTYSAKQFGDCPGILAEEAFLLQAQPGDYCFVEDQALAPLEDRISRLILCRWNRQYPADRFLDLDLKRWRLCSTRDFPGSSHEKITIEVYEK